mmetsp:Transcript_45048/g.101695  ORF Transcript_45048/g.101695 Transcript_45048/m.101695 type:complete len:227 (+) Transcript_45048:657-1337(+)
MCEALLRAFHGMVRKEPALVRLLALAPDGLVRRPLRLPRRVGRLRGAPGRLFPCLDLLPLEAQLLHHPRPCGHLDRRLEGAPRLPLAVRGPRRESLLPQGQARFKERRRERGGGRFGDLARAGLQRKRTHGGLRALRRDPVRSRVGREGAHGVLRAERGLSGHLRVLRLVAVPEQGRARDSQFGGVPGGGLGALLADRRWERCGLAPLVSDRPPHAWPPLRRLRRG